MGKSDQLEGDLPAGGKDAMMEAQVHRQAARPAPVDPKIQSEIGKQLRAIYDDVINEPVPSKFMELLEQLEQSSAAKR